MEGKTEINEKDKISDFPDFILHRILSFLPRKDANKTCALSKRWRFIWDTFPIFDFDQYKYLKGHIGLTPKYIEKTREFMNVVDKSLQKFVHYKLSMERFYLNLPLIDGNHALMVDQWVALALDSGVRELSLTVRKDYRTNDRTYTLPETTFVAKSISGCFKLGRLQKLSLHRIPISENIIHNIVRHCPNLSTLHLEQFSGLKALEISKLNKLERVSIVSTGFLRDLHRVDIDAPNLKHFSFDTRNCLYCSINLTSCHDLKELHLSSCSITDELLHLYLSRFPLLEVLELTNCPMLRKFEISAQQLKSLRLFFGLTKIERVQIDAPSISSFEYTTFDMPVLFSKNIPCLMKITYVVEHKVVDSSWFSQLREFIGYSSQRKFLTLKFYLCKVNFDLKEVGEEEMPPLVEVDHLTLTSFNMKASVDCAALIDGLLWSCQPKTLTIPLNSMFEIKCIKVLYKKLLDRERTSCCDSSNIKCWHHHLKDVKIETFGTKIYESLLHSSHFFHTLPSLGKEHGVRFILKWDY